jgi:hypothetical protein
MTANEADLDALLDHLFRSTPLFFVRDFLRQQKRSVQRIRIGVTTKEVRANLRDAVLLQAIGISDLQRWIEGVEGWGKQHLYISRVGRRALTHAQLLNTSSLRTFLAKRRLLGEDAPPEAEPSAHAIGAVHVDDERVAITWRSHSIDHERREELDEHRELEDGEYEFRAFRQVPRRTASRLIVRKTDGIVLILIDIPLGDDHDAAKKRIDDACSLILAPLVTAAVPLDPMVRALDQDAVAAFGPRRRRGLDIEVSPTQARYRTDGARVEFKSTRESAGYVSSSAARVVRQALQVSRFVGEAGKFHLRFQSPDRQDHAMVVSFNATEGRMFLFSRMDETEVLRLVDQLIALA